MIRAAIAGILALTFPFLAFPQSLKEFEKKVTEFTLSNGLHFMVVERHDAPVVAFNSYANVGSVDDPSGKTGLAHMFEHMAFKGTPNIGSINWPLEKTALQEIESVYDELEAERNKGVRADQAKTKQLEARLQSAIENGDKYRVPNYYTQLIEQNGGAGLNAQTAMDSTSFFYKLPANKLELWFLLESERFYSPVFREFYKELSVVREERRMGVESNPQGQMSELLSSTAFEAHPYHHPPVGWASDIESFRLRDALVFYKEFYVPSNISISIVGDVDPKKARSLAEKYFGIISAAPNPPPVHTIEPEQNGLRRANVGSPSQPIELIGYKRPSNQSPDDLVLDVISEILSGGRTGTIYKEMVRDKQLALDAGAEASFPGGKYPNLFIFYLVPNQGRTLDECERSLAGLLEQLRKEKVDEATLRRVKTKLRASLISRLDDNASLAADLNAYYWAYGDWRRLFNEVDLYDNITADQVMRVASSVFVPTARTEVRLVPGEATGNPEMPGVK